MDCFSPIVLVVPFAWKKPRNCFINILLSSVDTSRDLPTSIVKRVDKLLDFRAWVVCKLDGLLGRMFDFVEGSS